MMISFDLMKRAKIISCVLVLASLTLCVVAPATAQEGYKVSSVSVGSGESPVTSGIVATVDLKTEKGGFVEVTAQQEQAWLMAGRDFKTVKSKCSLYATVGHFQGAPWVGPYAGCTVSLGKVGGQEISVGALTRPGFFLGREPRDWRNDGKRNPESVLAGYLSIAQLNIGGLALSYSYLNFLDDPTNLLPGVGYTGKVREDVEVTVSATWNSNADRSMYFIGATWLPGK